MIKVAALLVLSLALALGEEAEVTTAAVEMTPSEGDVTATTKPEEEKNPEKRGLFRVTGVHGENPSQYQVVYALPQPLPPHSYQPPAPAAVETRSIPAATARDPAFLRPYPMAYSAQPTFQQPYALPAPSYPIPYTAPTPMILLMMPPHPGNPYGSLMLLPLSPNQIPYHAAARAPLQLVPQYVPPAQYVKGYQSPYPAAHFKDQYQKPLGPQYQEQSSSAEDGSQESSGASTTLNFGARMRPEQYIKG